MRKFVLLAAVFAVAMSGTAKQPGDASESRWEAVDVYVDSGKVPLAAYQLEVQASMDPAGRAVKLVGVEGGEQGGAFGDPPYYDPDALRGERIVLAAYSLAAEGSLPTGRTRVARLHVQVPEAGTPTYRCILTVAGNGMAEEIDAKAEAARLVPATNQAAPAPATPPASPPPPAPPTPSKR